MATLYLTQKTSAGRMTTRKKVAEVYSTYHVSERNYTQISMNSCGVVNIYTEEGCLFAGSAEELINKLKTK